MKKQLRIGGLILLGCIVLAAVLIVLRPDPPQRPPQSQVPLVQTAPADVRSGSLVVDGAGTVRALDEVALSPQVAGKVVYVHPGLLAGGTVRRGEVLVRIDPADYRNAVEQARAEVAQQEVAVLQAEEEAKIAQTEYERFRSREERRASGPFASVDPDDYAARTLPREPQAGGQAPVEGHPEGEPGSLVLREPQLRAARAALDRARATLEDARLALERTAVRAPFTGLVRSESVALGSYVSPGQPLAQIVASNAVEIRVPLTRDEAALIPTLWAGRGPGRITARAYADYGDHRYCWTGFVDRANAVLDPETRTIDVIVRIPDPIRGGRRISAEPSDPPRDPRVVPTQAPPLLVGEFVRVKIEGASLDRFVVVPRAALRPGDEVWAVRDSSIRIVPVRVVQQVDEQVYLSADEISDGEPVIVSELRVATEGMRVRLPESSRSYAP